MASSTSRGAGPSTRTLHALAAVVIAIFAVAACTGPTPTSSTVVASVAPWQPIDPTFTGCGGVGACDARVDHASPDVVIQPDATVGQLTYCPVSGAVFRIDATRPHADVDGKTLYFCCAACATYFANHPAEVLRARGTSTGG